MIDFNTQQLSWIVVGALGIGGTGYVSMNQKIDTLDTKISVTIANLEQLQKQLERVENKLDKKTDK